ncbi:MAG TPA: hypothetical protein VG895_04820 [Patescibacteria group bacterium]|nr:hypothetical protein [Patescibacteria group bacterium]
MVEQNNKPKLSAEESYNKFMQELEELNEKLGSSTVEIIRLVNNAISAGSQTQGTPEEVHNKIASAYSLGIHKLTFRLNYSDELAPIIAAYITQQGEHRREIIKLQQTNK